MDIVLHWLTLWPEFIFPSMWEIHHEGRFSRPWSSDLSMGTWDGILSTKIGMKGIDMYCIFKVARNMGWITFRCFFWRFLDIVHISGLYWAVFAWGLSLPDPSGASEAARIACLDPQNMAIPEAHTWRITCPGRNRSDFFKWISPSVLWETEIQSNDLGWSLRLAAACCLCRSSGVGLGGHVSTCHFAGLDGVSLSQKLPRCISIYCYCYYYSIWKDL